MYELAKEKDWDIVSFEATTDDVHLFFVAIR
ncbi:hypothetical protein [Umezakia ovalisporum]|jgi:REP element-mobilizing transposase RayT